VSDRRLDWHHLAFLGVGLVAGWMISGYGPITSSPDLRGVLHRLHAQTLANQESDAQERMWRLTADRMRHEYAEAMRDTTAKYHRQSQQLASLNRADLAAEAKKARERGDTSSAREITRIAGNVAAQDSACSSAVSSCQAAQDSLRVQVSERDSLIGVRSAQRDTATALSTDAVGVAQREHRGAVKAKVVAVGALLLLVLSVVR
jgi:hypothetical protein